MKIYRACLADAYVLRETLEFLVQQADFYEAEKDRYERLLDECDDHDPYLEEQMEEYDAKRAAFERMLSKLTK